MSDRLAIAILAAGAASRFGGGKLDVEIGERRLGDFALQTACQLGRPFLVVSMDTPEFALAAALDGKADLLVNPLSDRGLSTSVALAAQRAEIAGAEHLLILLADMPLVSAATLNLLVDAAATGNPAAVLHNGERLGIPACFPRDWFARLQLITGDRGASALLSEAVTTKPVDIPQEELRDIDRPEDLVGLQVT